MEILISLMIIALIGVVVTLLGIGTEIKGVKGELQRANDLHALKEVHEL